MTGSFDRIAKPYHFLERLFFQKKLQEARLFCLPYTANKSRALILGDGDGRFANALLERNSNIYIDSIDTSKVMLNLSAQRSVQYSNRLNLIQADALNYSYPKNQYDLICLHFVMDCFTQKQSDQLVVTLAKALKPNGVIAYSDFRANNTFQRLIIRILYALFKFSAGVSTTRLPQIQWPQHLEYRATHTALNGLLMSEILINDVERKSLLDS